MSPSVDVANQRRTPPHGKATAVVGMILIALLYLRMGAAAANGLGIRGLTQITTLMILGFVGMILMSRPAWPRHISLWLAGWTMMLSAGLVSMYLNGLIGNGESWEFQAQVGLYACFLPVFAMVQRAYPDLMTRGVYTFLHCFLILGFLMGLYQLASGHLFKGGRIYGLAAHPVSWGLQVIVALTLLELLRVRLGRRVSWLVIILALITLYLTKSRTAWLLGTLILLAYGGSHFKLGWRAMFYVTLSLALVAVGLWSGRFADLSSVPTFIANTDFNAAQYDFRYVDNSMSWRIWSWVQSAKDIMDRPLFGYGPGQTIHVSDFGLAMHNIILEILVQVGFLGMIGFAMMLIGHIPILRRLPQRTPVRRLIGAFLLFFFLAATFGTSMIYQTVTILLYLMLLANVIMWPQEQSQAPHKAPASR